MRASSRARAVSLLVGLALVAVACGGDDDDTPTTQATGKKGGTFRFGITEPKFIDPYNAQESEGITVTKLLFNGLTDATPEGKVVDDVAASHSSNDDCSEWTFKLKSAQKFSNGEDVNAEAFIRGMNRAVQKASASDVAIQMSGIAGFDEVQKGTAQAMTGLTAPDPLTLKVKLAKADCQFDLKTTHPVMSPVPSVAGAGKNKTFNEMPIGNGPFMMAEPWKHNTSITLVRNENFSGTKANLDRVEISLLNPDNAQELEYQGFQSGKFDWARIPTPQLTPAKQRYESAGKFLKKDTNGMNYLLPVGDNGPMKTKEARLAVSWAIDRDLILSGVFKGLLTKSTTIVPPVFEDFYQEGLCESCQKQDKAKAKALAEQAGLKAGTVVKIQFNTGAGHDEYIQAIKQQLEEVLGWSIDLVGTDFPTLLDAQQAPIGSGAAKGKPGSSGLFRFAWGADYPTPDNFLFPLLHTAAINKDDKGKVQGDNRARYSNPAFDKLIDDARKEKDPAKAQALQQQAEKLALDDMALIPLWNRTQYRLAATDKFANMALDFNENPTLEVISLK